MKIVFILNSITITRCHKRIEEFINNGYEVDVYGFAHYGQVYSIPKDFHIEQVGYYTKTMNYIQRLFVILKALHLIHRKYKHQKNIVFYYFFFDVAFAASFISNRKYIYEESDIPYSNINPLLLRKILKWYDKKIIRRSLLTTMTSEGFVKYHNLKEKSSNIVLVPNKVHSKLLELPYKHKVIDMQKISIGFVGGFRYQSIYNFANIIANEFPNINFHIFGNIIENKDELNNLHNNFPNIQIHGIFKNPEDLPFIYEQIDLVLATYDSTSINAQYAEPNKMYESIFFRVPIIVSQGTFLSEKVEALNIGYSVNGLEQRQIRNFLINLTEESIKSKINEMDNIPKKEVVSNNLNLFTCLEDKLIKNHLI